MEEATRCGIVIVPKEPFGFLHRYQCERPAKGELDGRPACGLHIGAAKRAVKQREAAEERAQQSRRRQQREREAINRYPTLLAAARAVVADWDRWADEPWNPEEPHWANFAVTLDALRAAVETRGVP